MTTCAVLSCDRGAERRAYCYGHYRRWRRGQDLDAPWTRAPSSATCAVGDCERRAEARGYCGRHYQRLRDGVSLTAPLRGYGTYRRINESGYVEVWGRRAGNAPGKYQLEHRMVMESVIGRALLPGENVHHRNGDRSDNRPENLELWASAQPAGQRVSDLVAWAREILATYADLAA